MHPNPASRLCQSCAAATRRLVRARAAASRAAAALALAMLVALGALPLRAVAETPVSIAMKLLVVSANGTEPSFAAITSVLKQVGVPYDTLIATQTPLTAGMLSDGLGNGRYQGVLLSTGNLGYLNPATGNYESAFSAAQWQALWNYEQSFRVRQATLYTYPSGFPDNYGLTLITYANTTATPLQASLTAAGKGIFNYVNGANPITITNAWTYLATPAGSNVVPLLSTSNGYAIASIYTSADGRQNLTITADENPDLRHTLQLAYGVINWVSKGVFLGQRHVYMSPQPDDILIDDDIWDTRSLTDTTGLTYRMTGTDFLNATVWQGNLNRNVPNAANIKIEWPFVGQGATGIYLLDTLTPVVALNQGAFRWISHTYTHANLDAISSAAATTELQKNVQIARQLGLRLFTADSMVQPDVSGLGNPNFLSAANTFGIRYLVSDTSQPAWNNPSPNTGFTSQYQPSMLIIPRHPTNLYYNVTTPAQWVSEYNHFYAPGGLFPTWDHPLSYSEILDKESEIWLRYMLKYDIDPIMFHQPNLAQYGLLSTSTLLGDLMGATLNKYNALFALPVLSLAEHDIGAAMAARMAYNASGAGGTLLLGATGNSIRLATTKAVTVPVTGISYGTSVETYGGQPISSIALPAGGTLTVPGPAW
ncbi:hypothetical protein [Burkholderia stagnalis]|uniref:Agd3-related carbohydrate deacetylase n=1 Tax=Burkholderia stagnalis TaxID=1503054 RepID=UPI00075FDA75|nr:hypothetical protein [Burkholderia stagnalis]KWJ00003.1 hypothetical protein WT76_26440 [Burkholderia stagnalis]KWO26246.1 hypothetical protein WT94_11215 [Burkholderia stagnalis]